MNFMQIVCKYDSARKELKGSILTKARRFCREGCVRPVRGKEGIFKVLPIRGYNMTTYDVNIFLDECNCQSNQLHGKICSHLVACYLWDKLRSSNLCCAPWPRREE